MRIGAPQSVVPLAIFLTVFCTPYSVEGARQSAGASSPGTAGSSAMFRGDPAHSGVFETVGVEELGGVAWEFQTGGPIRSTAALADGTLYVGSTDGHLYALAAADGTERWSFDAGRPVGSSPAVVGGLVIFGDRANVFRALDRATGRPVWTLETGPDLALKWGWEGWDYLAASPVVVRLEDRDLVLFGSGNGTLYSVDAASGEVIWTYPTGGRLRGTPAVAAGTVYIGSGDGLVHALALESGQTRWTFETAGSGMDAQDFGFDRTQIQSSPAVSGGVVYIGSRDASLYALDAASGERLWTFEDGSAWVVNSVAVRNDILLVGRSSSGRLRRLDAATGEERWVVATGGPVFSSPALVDDVAYVGNGLGWLFAIDVEDGTERWRYRTDGGIYASPVVADGRLYIGADDGVLRALEAGPETPRLAVFWDDSLQSRSAWGGQDSHIQATEYFESNGYERLDAPRLVEFMERRIDDHRPSVIVFGMDALPVGVAEGPAASTLFRRYLAAEGKIVWLGYPPRMLARDSTGAFAGIDREAASTLLGVDLSAWDSDGYGSFPTETGRAWGLQEWIVANPIARSDAVDLVLALDELGRATAWVQSYGGPSGRGFVFLPGSTAPHRLDEIRRVAEVGLMRTVPMSDP